MYDPLVEDSAAAAAANQQASSTTVSTTVTDLVTNGATASTTVRGVYDFNNLDFADDLNGNKPYAYLTIGSARALTTNITNNYTTFTAQLTSTLAQLLPVSASQISVVSEVAHA